MKPVTKRDVQQPGRDSLQEKFRDIRKKVGCVVKLASDEYIQRKVKRKRHPAVPMPAHYPGKQMVAQAGGYKSTDYLLVEVVDFEERKLWHGKSEFYYYGIVAAVTRKEDEARIGRMVRVGDCRSTKLNPDNIKWRKPDGEASND